MQLYIEILHILVDLDNSVWQWWRL